MVVGSLAPIEALSELFCGARAAKSDCRKRETAPKNLTAKKSKVFKLCGNFAPFVVKNNAPKI